MVVIKDLWSGRSLDCWEKSIFVKRSSGWVRCNTLTGSLMFRVLLSIPAKGRKVDCSVEFAIVDDSMLETLERA